MTAGLALVSSVAWRLVAQTVMERQVYGRSSDAIRYLEQIVYPELFDAKRRSSSPKSRSGGLGVFGDPRPWALRNAIPHGFEKWYGLLGWCTILLLVTSWGAIVWHLSLTDKNRESVGQSKAGIVASSQPASADAVKGSSHN